MKKNKVICRKVLLVVLTALCTAVLTTGAQATFITPKRVIIEDKQRTATVTINNTSDKTVAYRFEWEHRAQKPDGESVLLNRGETLEGYRPADDMLQFSPRQVLLKPGESQKVRILVKRPADLAEGEYHSHLLIRTEIVDKPQSEDAGAPRSLEGSLRINTNASIPVFLRQGKTTLDVKLTSAKFIPKGEDGRAHIEYAYTNNSTRSVYAIPKLICNGNADKAIIMSTARIYVESKNVTLTTPIPIDSDISHCMAMKLQLLPINDFEYKKEAITEIDVVK